MSQPLGVMRVVLCLHDFKSLPLENKRACNLVSLIVNTLWTFGWGSSEVKLLVQYLPPVQHRIWN